MTSGGEGGKKQDSQDGEAHGAARPKTEGRRERKKRETRQRLSDIATGLFLERGFDPVTISEIAESADVSVNTVYNYFPSKEDLFFDRTEEMVDRSARAVREREPGDSAADALLGRLRSDIAERNMYAGMREGYDAFMRCVRGAPSLMARLYMMQHDVADRLAATLREESGAADDDPTPDLVAEQLVHFSNFVFRGTTRAIARGDDSDAVARQALERIDAFETLVTDTVLRYATRPGGGGRTGARSGAGTGVSAKGGRAHSARTRRSGADRTPPV